MKIPKNKITGDMNGILSQYLIKERVKVAQSYLKGKKRILDIGCGDGRVLRKVHNRYGARAIGYEVNPLAYLKAKLLCLGLKDVAVKWRSFWTAELSSADVVFCYLFPDVMRDLAVKLKSELKPGAVVVSCNFDLPGFTPKQILHPGNSLNNDPIYVYRVQ